MNLRRHYIGPFPPGEDWADDRTGWSAMPKWRRRRRWGPSLVSRGPTPIPPLRERLRARDGDQCHWCERIMSFDGNPNADRYATIEHLVKKEHGGMNIPEHTALACRKCNNERH